MSEPPKTERPSAEEIEAYRGAVVLLRSSHRVSQVKTADMVERLLTEVDWLREEVRREEEFSRQMEASRDVALLDRREEEHLGAVALDQIDALKAALDAEKAAHQVTRDTAAAHLHLSMAQLLDPSVRELSAVLHRAQTAERERDAEKARADEAVLALERLRWSAEAYLEIQHNLGEDEAREALCAALSATPATLADQLRREMRAEGMEEAISLVSADLQSESVSRDRAYSDG